MAEESIPQKAGAGSGDGPSPNFGPTVTILFSDIRGFTEFTDAHGDEAAYRMLQHHNALVQEQIALFGGHIVKTLGDSYMVSFDAARNAVACGVAIQRALAQHNATQKGAKIQIGVGINTGEPIREGNDLFGGSVNLASRICAAAGAGCVLVSDPVRHLVGVMKGAGYIDRGLFELKGFQEPQHLFEVDWSGTGAARPVTAAAPRSHPVSGAAPKAPPAAKAAFLGLPVLVWLCFAIVGAAVAGALYFRPQVPSPAETAAVSEPETAALAPAAGGTPARNEPAPVPPAGTEKPSAAETAPKPSAVAPHALSDAEAARTATGPGGNRGVARGGTLLAADNFSDPAKGLFQTSQRGPGRVNLTSGATVPFQWDYAYADSSLTAHVRGTYPEGSERPLLAVTMPWSKSLSGDYAIEVHAHATRSAPQARYGIALGMDGGRAVVFSVGAADGFYSLNFAGARGLALRGQAQRSMVRGQAPMMSNGDNSLRVAVRAGVLHLFVNGKEVDRYRNEGVTQLPGNGALWAALTGPPTDGELEVRFSDFKIFALGQ